MQFTPQQLSGGPKYSAKVKVGNWAEDKARLEVRGLGFHPMLAVVCRRMAAFAHVVRLCPCWFTAPLGLQLEAKDFELRKSRGTLSTTHKAKAAAIAMQTVTSYCLRAFRITHALPPHALIQYLSMHIQVPHSYADDGCVRFSDSVQLRISHTDASERVTNSFLANNIWNRVDFDKNTIAVTAISHAAPVARNVFVITRPYTKSGAATGERGRLGVTTASVAASMRRAAAGGGGGGSSDGVLRYGDRFFLATNPSLRVDERTGMVAAPYLLSSEVKQPVCLFVFCLYVLWLSIFKCTGADATMKGDVRIHPCGWVRLSACTLLACQHLVHLLLI